MATYGGGITFTQTKTFTNVSDNNSVVVLTVGAGTYVDFKPLYANAISFTVLNGTQRFVVQHDDGAGGWVNTTILESYAFATGNVFTSEWRLFEGQRVVAQTSGTTAPATVRYVYSYVEYEAST